MVATVKLALVPDALPVTSPPDTNTDPAFTIGVVKFVEITRLFTVALIVFAFVIIRLVAVIELVNRDFIVP